MKSESTKVEMKWFRFYHEFVDDPKIAMMSDSDQLLWIKALCLANEGASRGLITLSDDEICWKLRITVESWRHAIDKFRAKGMIEHFEGGYKIVNWTKRQFESDSSTPRVQKSRSKAKQPCNVSETPTKQPCNVSETPSDTDTDTDTDTDQHFGNNFKLSCVVRDAKASEPPAIAEGEFSDFFEEPDFDRVLDLRSIQLEGQELETDFASDPPQTTSTLEAKQKTKRSARRRADAAIPENHPETFADWWKTYYEFCLRVDCSPGDRATAATTWDVLHAVEPDCTARILEGTDWYCAVKDREFKAKGEAVGVSHGCRFLSKRKWQEALDHKALKPDYLTTHEPKQSEEEASAKRLARLKEIRAQKEAENANRKFV